MDYGWLWFIVVYGWVYHYLMGKSKNIYRYRYINRNFININGSIFWIMLTEPWPSQKKGLFRGHDGCV